MTDRHSCVPSPARDGQTEVGHTTDGVDDSAATSAAADSIAAAASYSAVSAGGKTGTSDVADPTVPALAYLGDAVIELMTRETLVRRGLCGSASLNAAARDYVCAPAQSDAVERLLPHLDDSEAAIYRRGRNAGHGKNTPHGASVAQYRRATGLEVLFGSLYLDGRTERLSALFAIAYPDATAK